MELAKEFGRVKRSSLAGLVFALLAACSGQGEEGDSARRDSSLEGGSQQQELDPCGGADHPCTLAEVTPEAEARTQELANLVLERLQSPDDLEDAAEWLSAQGGVASVATGPEALRFRVRGGRGHWIFVQTLGTVGRLGAPTIAKPPRKPAADTRRPSHAGQLLAAAPGAAAPAPSFLQGTTKGREKRALLLSPFRWQWEVEGGNDGVEDIARALRARDYTTVDVWTERLDPENPSCATAARWDPEGQRCTTIGEIGLSAFTTWRGYDFVYLVTHGGFVRTPLGERLTVVMTPWTEDQVTRARAAVEAGGNEELANLLYTVGTETADIGLYLPDDRRVPWVGPGQEVKTDIPMRQLRDAPHGFEYHRGLSPAERSWCQQELQRKSDLARYEEASEQSPQDATVRVVDVIARTDGGKPCVQYTERTRTGPFIVLTSKFFNATYQGAGIDDAVILISACSSGNQDDLLEALRGEHTAVIGWRTTMQLSAAAAAGALLAKALVEVDERLEDDSGLTVRQSMDRIRDRLTEIEQAEWDSSECVDPSDPEVQARCVFARYGRVLAVINDQPADPVTGASLRVTGDESIRAREIIYLVDEAGEDLRDGSMLDVIGSPGDGRADSVDLRIRVDGLGEEDDPRAVDLKIVFEDREIDLDRSLEEEVFPGVWELAYRLPLGRDHRDRERVSIEPVAGLPEGGDSRWEYRDLVLSGGCGFGANVSAGPYAGAREGPAHLLGPALFLSDASGDWEALVAVPSFEPGEYETGMTVTATFPHPRDPSRTVAVPADAPDGNREAPATLYIDRSEGDFGMGRGEASLEGRLVGRAGWRRLYGGGDVYFDVDARFRAVKFAVGPRSRYQACRDGWGLESSGDMLRQLEGG